MRTLPCWQCFLDCWTAGGSELWALGSELWALGSELWALSSELWALDSGELWALYSIHELWALSSELWWASSLTVFHLAVQKWCIPALFTYIPSLSQHVLACISMCAFILHSSTACVHFNYFRALFACIFIGISVYRTQYSGLSEKCLNVVGMHAHSAGTRQELCASLLCSSTASRGKVPKISTLCLHFYCFLLTILFSFSITFPLCIAFPYAFPMIVKPPSHIRMIKNLNPLQQPKKWNLSTMLTATKQVKPFLLALSTCISAALDCSWTALGCCWGLSWHVSCLNRTKECHLPGSECHLPGSECHHGFRMPSSGGSAGLQRGRPAYTKHRSRSHKKGTSVGKF